MYTLTSNDGLYELVEYILIEQSPLLHATIQVVWRRRPYLGAFKRPEK